MGDHPLTPAEGASGDRVEDVWAADAEVKRRAWARLTPTQRWEWLVDALELAAATGALQRDRRRRAAEAAAWPASGSRGR